MSKKLKEIDFKSFVIGFLLAAVLFLSIAAASGAGSGTLDVRIVDISTYDNLRVKIDDVGSVVVPVELKDVSYSVEVPVKIKSVDYNVKVPVQIER